jgi:hypothetical protein
MWDNEWDSFALFPDDISRFQTIGRTKEAYISTLSIDTFEAAPFFAPSLEASRIQELTSGPLMLMDTAIRTCQLQVGGVRGPDWLGEIQGGGECSAEEEMRRKMSKVRVK